MVEKATPNRAIKLPTPAKPGAPGASSPKSTSAVNKPGNSKGSRPLWNHPFISAFLTSEFSDDRLAASRRFAGRSLRAISPGSCAQHGIGGGAERGRLHGSVHVRCQSGEMASGPYDLVLRDHDSGQPAGLSGFRRTFRLSVQFLLRGPGSASSAAAPGNADAAVARHRHGLSRPCRRRDGKGHRRGQRRVARLPPAGSAP